MKKRGIIVFAALLSLSGAALAHDHNAHISPPAPGAAQVGEDKSEPQAASPVAPERGGLPQTPDVGAVKPRDIQTDLQELSPWSMFQAADALVKAVMISLALASLLTWTVFFAKVTMIRLARRRLERSLADVSKAKTLTDAEQSAGVKSEFLKSLFAAASQEVQMSGARSSASGIKERAASRFSEIIRSESRTMRTGMGALATIGATAPFIGLFGTVWGIMNSFIGISKAQTTNLAVVAPGIAEALLATACGLAAAIPAVMLYNYLTRSVKGYLDLASDAAGATGRLLSRTLEERKTRLEAPAEG